MIFAELAVAVAVILAALIRRAQLLAERSTPYQPRHRKARP